MAEARQAVAFQFAVTTAGVRVDFDKEAIKSAGKALLGFTRSQYLRIRNAVLRGVFPASPYSLIGIASVVYGTHYFGWDPTFGVGGLLAGISRKLGLSGDFFPTGVMVCEVMGLWVFFSYLQRYLLRGLLSYQGWMFDQHGRRSWSTRVWSIGVRVLTMFTSPQLYSYQSSLPRLPVPALRDTCTRYLESVRPLLSDTHYSEMESLVTNFQAGPGKKMQRYLVLKSWWANNYVTDWWETYVYLHGRSSIMINSNYYACGMVGGDTWMSNNPVARAALISHILMRLKREIHRGKLKPLLVMGVVPLCSAQYERLFGTVRRPGRNCDQLLHCDGPESDYCVCCRSGRWYKIPLTSPQGRIYSPGEMECLFQMVWKDVEREVREGVAARKGEEHLAALTAFGREEWAQVLEEHFMSGVNQVSMETVEKAAYVLMFDDLEPVTKVKDGDCTNLSAYCKDLIHGNGYSRWFDKSMTVIIYSNGKLGINAEHSWADAPIVGYVMEYSCNLEHQIGYVDSHCEGYEHAHPSVHPKRLEWDLTPACVGQIESAYTFAQDQISDFDLYVLKHDDYGKGVMKKCGISPDAFIQMALQMAYFKDAGKFCLTYEASMTRLFLEGRTETVRPVTIESTSFVRAMCGDQKHTYTVDAKKALLRVATVNHATSYKMAMTGRGIDRHLFCLYVMSKYLKLESPFLNKVLQEPWRLSTSQTPAQQTGKIDYNKHPEKISGGGGFGPVAKDGYGVSYIIQGDQVVFFHVSAFKSSKETDAYRFAGFIRESLREMKALFQH